MSSREGKLGCRSLGGDGVNCQVTPGRWREGRGDPGLSSAGLGYGVPVQR